MLDKSYAYGVVRKDFEVAFDESGDAFSHYAIDVRVIARIAAVITAPSRSARKLVVTP